MLRYVMGAEESKMVRSDDMRILSLTAAQRIYEIAQKRTRSETVRYIQRYAADMKTRRALIVAFQMLRKYYQKWLTRPYTKWDAIQRQMLADAETWTKLLKVYRDRDLTIEDVTRAFYDNLVHYEDDYSKRDRLTTVNILDAMRRDVISKADAKLKGKWAVAGGDDDLPRRAKTSKSVRFAL